MNENERTAEFLTELDNSLVNELLTNENLERIASIIEKPQQVIKVEYLIFLKRKKHSLLLSY